MKTGPVYVTMCDFSILFSPAPVTLLNDKQTRHVRNLPIVLCCCAPTQRQNQANVSLSIRSNFPICIYNDLIYKLMPTQNVKKITVAKMQTIYSEITSSYWLAVFCQSKPSSATLMQSHLIQIPCHISYKSQYIQTLRTTSIRCPTRRNVITAMTYSACLASTAGKLTHVEVKVSLYSLFMTSVVPNMFLRLYWA